MAAWKTWKYLEIPVKIPLKTLIPDCFILVGQFVNPSISFCFILYLYFFYILKGFLDWDHWMVQDVEAFFSFFITRSFTISRSWKISATAAKLAWKCSSWLCHKALAMEFAAAREVGRTFHGYHRCGVDKPNCWAKIRHSKRQRSVLDATR